METAFICYTYYNTCGIVTHLFHVSLTFLLATLGFQCFDSEWCCAAHLRLLNLNPSPAFNIL